jgi:hypothetical protein
MFILFPLIQFHEHVSHRVTHIFYTVFTWVGAKLVVVKHVEQKNVLLKFVCASHLLNPENTNAQFLDSLPCFYPYYPSLRIKKITSCT